MNTGATEGAMTKPKVGTINMNFASTLTPQLPYRGKMAPPPKPMKPNPVT